MRSAVTSWPAAFPARLPVDAPIDAGVLVGPAVLEAVPLVVHGGLGGGECDGEGSVQVPLAQPAVIAAVPRGDDQLVRRLERREVQVERSLVVGLDVAHAVGAAAGRLFHEFRVEQTHLQGGDGRVRRKPVYRYKREVVVVFVDEALLGPRRQETLLPRPGRTRARRGRRAGGSTLPESAKLMPTPKTPPSLKPPRCI